MGVEGTTEVFNEVRQGQPIGLGTASSDTWITTKVRSQLLGTDQVKSSNVKVTTENGEVFLMGLVTDREGRAGGGYRQPGQRRFSRHNRGLPTSSKHRISGDNPSALSPGKSSQ
ncbi:outer membrane lipoprotein [Raoultella terrigena]|uniref:Outer membrane lipoprotein n=1 Tax=Raoultella terrigena TaxID=577 RepID=A0A4U9D7Z1_RAOTE|nr:outer membrane lipoprotein [Raoultella terrigena]